jgi:hypothetical protein
MSLPITAAAYGFPKNPQGDSKNTIYSCLTFDQFTIGTIGSLSGVDPGSEYNVDPYVLAYQPYISAFGRKDFIINIQNATGVYVVGEKVNQVLPNLVYYDVKVDNGVYNNSYVEESFVVNTKDDIQSSNDFILYTSNTVTFNSTDDVNSNADFIALANATFYYPANTYVRYYTNASNTVVTGLSNNAFYYVATANDTGVTLSLTPGGSNVTINALANSATFNSNTSVNTATDFISITSANTLFANGQQVRYITTSTVVTGLSNNELYYVGYANSTGLALSLTSGGSNVDITGLNPGDGNHNLRYYNPNFNGHNLVKYASEFANNQRILYRVPTSNTVISGLANNTAYYVVSANTIGFKVSATRGGANINITAAGTGESHNFSTVAGFLPGDLVYQSTTPVMNASIQSIFSNTTGDYVRVTGNTQVINVTTSNTLLSYSNPYVTANVSSVSLFQIISSAKGIIKSANTTVARVKRLSFENTFVSGSLLIGDVSGVSANITAVAEDSDVLYPIGLNASIEANVITASGQITSLQVIDSGVGYSNGDIVQYTSEDGTRSGSIKIVNDGNGIGKGYYKSSKGFLSEDMYVHDGDYYQEYSYEILSKISVDRYSDMFKKVMHTAGTKFFGSALIVAEANVALSLTEISTGDQLQFNSATDVSSANETIIVGRQVASKLFNALTDVDISNNFFSIAPNPFANNDIIRYTTITGNVPITDLANNATYYVVFSNTSGIKISATPAGAPIAVTIPSYSMSFDFITGLYYVDESTNGHMFASYTNAFVNNDIVTYSTENANVVVQGLIDNTNYYIVQTSEITVKLALTSNGTPINITANGTHSGSATAGHNLTKTVEE